MTTPTNVPVRLKLRQDTAANWTSVNPTLLAGELGRESDTGKIKIGTGSTAWNSLAYQAWATLPVAVNAGGTGQTTYTNGQLLIGNTTGNTLTKATLTAGSGVAITNGTGSITVAASNIADAQISATAEIAVAKLADGAARQLLQTDAAGTGVEWASNIDIPGTLDVTSAATFDSNVIIQGDLTVNGTETIINTQTLEVEDKNIIVGKVTTPTDVTADGGGITLKGTTDKTINWVDATDAWTFSEHVDLASAKEYRIAGTKVLDATSLGSAVISSSLTSVGTIGTGVWQGTAISKTYLDSTLVSTGDTGTVTSTMILDGTIVNADINASAAIADTKLDTIATAGKVSNSATTATSANTNSAIVARDGSGNFSAGTITAALTGAASSNVLKAGDTMTGALVVPLGAVGTPSLTFTSDLNTGIYSPGADQVAVATNGVERVEFGTGEVVFNDGGANYDFRIEGDTNANLFFVDASAEAVGIGTSSPQGPLHVTNGSSTTYFSRSTGDTGVSNTALSLTTGTGSVSLNASAPLLAFRTGAVGTASQSQNIRMVIDTSGNVGIGTTSPAVPLNVVVNGSNPSSVSGATALMLTRSSTASGGVQMSLIGGNTSGVAINFGDSDSENPGRIVYDNSDNSLMFQTNAAERARIDSSGRLLLGTSSASGSLLEVAGQITGKYTNVGTNVAAQNLANNHVSQVVISANTTLTTAVAPAGTPAWVIIETSGATSRTVTFGSGFASTGTLATGTAAGRRFVVSFISDGTRFLETSRTVAITV